MVEHNHSWKDIKEYTLQEIGVFLRECVLKEHEMHKNNVLENWLGTNADGDYLQKHILNGESLQVNESQKKEKEKEEAKAARGQWARLAKAIGMHGL